MRRIEMLRVEDNVGDRDKGLWWDGGNGVRVRMKCVTGFFVDDATSTSHYGVTADLLLGDYCVPQHHYWATTELQGH